MENIILLNQNELARITNHRSGEIKFGEKNITVPKDVNIIDFIRSCEAKFVLFGITEDIGVRANYGRPGTASAYQSALNSLVNIQHNRFCKGGELLILGHLDLTKEIEASLILNPKVKDDRMELFKLVEKVDAEVSHVVHQIIKAGKIPIIIGGGHNNAYGNIKGLALAKGKPVNAINFDAHTDFRILEGRHSGNGFSYAYEDGFLKKYFVFGLHENFVSKSVFNTLKELTSRVKFVTYEEIDVKREKNFETELENALDFIKNEPFGVELDLDAIPKIPSSAMTFSGFSVDKARHYLYYFGKHKNASYLHICEGAPELDDSKNNHLTGKLIASMITDFMKAKALL